ncbi:hypothetical protein DLJ49_07010 [Rhodovulum sp. 12E13]|uniref:hypothetical protein n=1 Tax=Rhodovulum sp. 12E13 TaxID=2203891 RepID=UPI000E13DC6B|nr:hypothetical protein [Rhodovulum sp. 12E13]RDC73314.1 hypothetical protein DLJ49_07010 [Rhodovulum sp. 12E13]
MKAVSEFAVAFAVSFGLIVYVSAPDLFSEVGVWGDLAADMLHADALARAEWLTTGHYSRFRFNHPGPVFFYWNVLFEPLPVERLHAWMWGSVTLNALLVAGAATGLARLLLPGGSFALGAGIALLAVAVLGRDLSGVWMPRRIEAPFLLLVVSLAWLAEREARALAPAVLACGLLVHGYVTMAVLIPLVLAVALVLAVVSDAPWPPRRKLALHGLAALAIGAALLLPIAVEAAKLPGGNFADILAALDEQAAAPPAGWDGLRAAIDGSLGPDLPLLLAALFVAVALLAVAPPGRPLAGRLARLSVLCVASLAATAAAYWDTPAPLESHSVLYLRSLLVVAGAVSAAIIAEAAALPRGGAAPRPTVAPARGVFVPTGLMATVALAAGALLPQNLPGRVFAEDAYRQVPPTPWVERFAAEMARSGAPVAIDYTHHLQWATVAGVLATLTAGGTFACTTWRDRAFLYTDARVCPEGMPPSFRLVRETDCAGSCVVTGGDLGVQPVAR